MAKKVVSSLIILFIIGNLFITSSMLFCKYIKANSFCYSTSSAVMLNFSKVKNIQKGFVDICSNLGNMLEEYNRNDKIKTVISQKENNISSFPAIFTDKFTVNCMEQYKYGLLDISYFIVYSFIKKHIVYKPDRTSNIFLLLLLQILIYLIVLNMCKYFNKYYLDIRELHCLYRRCNFFYWSLK